MTGPVSQRYHGLPVDAHVHFHTPERAAQTLDAAAANFRTYSRCVSASGCLGMLLLTQASRERVFETLAQRSTCSRWHIVPSRDEPQTLIAERDEGWLAVVCGRQIRCVSGLEVAALGTAEEVADGRPLDETIGRVQAIPGALAVLPWGFGKWVGARGAAVRRALDAHSPGALAVGDNGGRLALWGRPALLGLAGRLGYLVLPGTDPFPFGGDYRRAGSFGFFADLSPRPDSPWRELRAWLLAQRQSPASYGRALSPWAFFVNQARIQLYNRRERRAA